jgi:hypothetical protein
VRQWRSPWISSLLSTPFRSFTNQFEISVCTSLNFSWNLIHRICSVLGIALSGRSLLDFAVSLTLEEQKRDFLSCVRGIRQPLDIEGVWYLCNWAHSSLNESRVNPKDIIPRICYSKAEEQKQGARWFPRRASAYAPLSSSSPLALRTLITFFEDCHQFLSSVRDSFSWNRKENFPDRVC